LLLAFEEAPALRGSLACGTRARCTRRRAWSSLRRAGGRARARAP